MEAVAKYLDLPAIQVFEVAAFYSMFETQACRQAQCLGVHQYFLHVARER